MKTISNWLLGLFKNILAALFRIILFIIGWLFKLISRITDRIGDEIIGLYGK